MGRTHTTRRKAWEHLATWACVPAAQHLLDTAPSCPSLLPAPDPVAHCRFLNPSQRSNVPPVKSGWELDIGRGESTPRGSANQTRTPCHATRGLIIIVTGASPMGPSVLHQDTGSHCRHTPLCSKEGSPSIITIPAPLSSLSAQHMGVARR